MNREPRLKARQLGQGMIEYTVVMAMLLFVLLRPNSNGLNVIEKVSGEIRDYYRGYAYAVSLSDYPDALTFAELIDACIRAGGSQVQCNNAVDAVTVVNTAINQIGSGLPSVPINPPTITLRDLLPF